MSAYELHKELRFTVRHEEFAIVSRSDFRIRIAETRKNGQEDCHMSGELINDRGVWRWSADCGRQSFDDYGNVGVADAIVEFINTNPPPEL